MKNLISLYASVHVGLEIDLEKNCAMGRNLRGKSIYAKPIFNYRFSGQAQMIAWLEKDLNRRLEIKAAEEARKEANKKALQNIPYQVGDLMYYSWGYDQTNVDFFQVIEVKTKSIVLQPIEGKMLPSNGYGSMAGLVAPIANTFHGKPIRKNVKAWVNSQGPQYYVNGDHGSIRPYTQEDRGVYCSWYA